MKENEAFVARENFIYNSHLIWISGKSYKLYKHAGNFKSHQFFIEPYEEYGYKIDFKMLPVNSVYDIFYTKKELRKLKLEKLKNE